MISSRLIQGWGAAILATGILLSAVALRAADLPGAEPVVESAEFLKPDPAPGFPVARVIVSLGLLLGGLFLAKPLIRKTPWGARSTGGGAGLKIVDRLSLSPRAGVCVIEAEGRRFLMGLSSDGVRLVAELPAGSGRAGTVLAAESPHA